MADGQHTRHLEPIKKHFEYYNTITVCEHLIFFDFSECDLNFHKQCTNNLKELCYGKKTRPPVAMDKPKPPPSTLIEKLKRKPSSAASTMAGGLYSSPP